MLREVQQPLTSGTTSIAESRIEGSERGDQVGCVRSFTLKDGNRIREQLLTLSDASDCEEHPLHRRGDFSPQRYVATVTLKPVTGWRPYLRAPGGKFLRKCREREPRRKRVAKDVYEAGFRQPVPLPEPAATCGKPAGATMPSALPLPARRAVNHRYGGP